MPGFYRVVLIVGLLVLAVSGGESRAGETIDPAKISLLAKDMVVDGRVAVIEMPASGLRFDLLWADQDRTIWKTAFTSVKGRHHYDPRPHPHWKGRVLGVFLDMPNTWGRVVKPDAAAEAGMLLAPQQALAYTANSLDGASPLGVGLTWWLFGAGLAASALVRALTRGRRPLAWCVLAGFLAVFALAGLRQAGGLIEMASNLEDNAYLRDVERFREVVQEGRALIGNGTWAHHDLPWPYPQQAKYLLSDLPRRDTARADVIVTHEHGRFAVRPR